MKSVTCKILNSEIDVVKCNECEKTITVGLPVYIDEDTANTYCSFECVDEKIENNDNQN